MYKRRTERQDRVAEETTPDPKTSSHPPPRPLIKIKWSLPYSFCHSANIYQFICHSANSSVITMEFDKICDSIKLCIFLYRKKKPAPIAQLVECPLRGTGGHGFDPGPRHTKVVNNGTSCSSLGTQTYGVELGLVGPVSG